jgi:threonine dehydrogenase-like Zn-dependent dehydrogenase
MKGLLFREPGVVVRADLDTPIPGGGEVLVQVKAAGICGWHLHGIADGMYPHPAVLRHEFAGITYPLDAAEPVFAELRSGRSSIVKAHFTTEDRSQ